jgi:hypothetical protein
MNSIAKRHNVFPILERYISLTDLDYPSSIQDIVPSLQKVLLLEASSRNAIFWEYKQYVLGKCLFRYDNDHQMTITSFATANMARSFHSHRDTEHSMFLP